MNTNQLLFSNGNHYNDGDTGFKVIEVNVTDPTENLYAVVTPVKKQ